MTLDSAVLLYTYISRFSVNPHYQQTRKIRQSCRHKFYPQLFLVAFFNFSHKRPTFAFTSESGYTLGFRRRIAHSGLHAETGVFWMGVVSLLSERSARSPTSPGRVSERQVLPLLGLGRVLPKNAESLRNSDAHKRIAVPQAFCDLREHPRPRPKSGKVCRFKSRLRRVSEPRKTV